VTRALAVLLALPLCACDKLAAFDLAEGESYCGLITLGSGYRAGFGPRVQMRLRFDADAVELGESPGRITTFDVDAPDPDEEKRNPLLKEDALRPIAPLSHDPLSQLQFGDGRDRNLVYAVTPHDVQHESLIAIVSLRSDETVEVRLLRPGSSASGDEDPYRVQLFGLFALSRQPGDCF
jgi:hypothetical protein